MVQVNEETTLGTGTHTRGWVDHPRCWDVPSQEPGPTPMGDSLCSYWTEDTPTWAQREQWLQAPLCKWWHPVMVLQQEGH